MPQGQEGYGMFDYNHLRQFWTLTKQNKENESLSILQTMQDEKKFLTDKIQDYEKEKTQKDTSSNSQNEFPDLKKKLE